MLDKLRSRYCLNRWQACSKRDLRDGLCAITFSFFVLSHHNPKSLTLMLKCSTTICSTLWTFIKTIHEGLEICSFSSGLFTWSLHVTVMIHWSEFVHVYIGNWFWWHIKPWYYNLHYLIHYYKNYHWDPKFENIDFKDIFNQSI